MGRIEVDEERCKGCEICISFCPKNVIALANRFNRLGYRPATMVNHESDQRDLVKCTGCGICARMCPDAAITVYKQRSETRDLLRAS